MSKSMVSCKKNVQATLSILLELGFIPNREKSILHPSTSIEFLGFIFDSVEMKISLPRRKIDGILKLIAKALNSSIQSVHDASKLIGTLIAATPAVQYSMLRTRQLEIDKINALHLSNGDYNANIVYSKTSIDDLGWWKNSLPNSCHPIITENYDVTIFTDASPTGWGITMNGKVTRGFWSLEQQQLHINTLELLAVLHGVESFLPGRKHLTILARVDSTTAKAYINRQGGCKSPINLAAARKIWEWCEDHANWIVATYINTKLNVIADHASRLQVDGNDFKLDSISFSKIQSKLGVPQIDLFASHQTNQCKNYYSWFPDPGCIGVDAFSYKWDTFFYAFPPFSLVARVLKKVINDSATGIIVVPNWKTQAWYPVFKELTKSKIVKLKKGSFLLISPYSHRPHPLNRTLNLMAAIVSAQK